MIPQPLMVKRRALLGKGAVNNQFNAFIMDHLKENGVETHLIEVIDSTDSLVYKLDMFQLNVLSEIELLDQYAKDLELKMVCARNPLFEFFLKDDELGDPLINDEHIIFGWANQEQIKEMKRQTYKVMILSKLFGFWSYSCRFQS